MYENPGEGGHGPPAADALVQKAKILGKFELSYSLFSHAYVNLPVQSNKCKAANGTNTRS